MTPDLCLSNQNHDPNSCLNNQNLTCVKANEAMIPDLCHSNQNHNR